MDISYWSANVAVLAAYLVAAAAHLRGMRGAATGGGPGQSPARPARPAGRAVAYQAGLLLALLAVVSPMGYWSYRFIWVRNLQDVVLAIVAPALIVLGAPWLPLSRGLGLSGRLRRLERSGQAEDEAGQVVQPGWQAVPILVTVAFCALWWVWHLPGPFDAAVTSSVVYAAEVVTYLAVGIAVLAPAGGVAAAAAPAGAAEQGCPRGRCGRVLHGARADPRVRPGAGVSGVPRPGPSVSSASSPTSRWAGRSCG